MLTASHLTTSAVAACVVWLMLHSARDGAGQFEDSAANGSKVVVSAPPTGTNSLESIDDPEQPALTEGVLRPITNPQRLVEYVNPPRTNTHVEPTADDVPVLNVRSIVF